MLEVNSQQPSDDLRVKEKELQRQHDTCLAMKECFWQQRSRIQMALEGDQNTAFFHASAVTRKRRNNIISIQNSQGDWVSDESEIRRVFIDYFRNLYKKTPTVQISHMLPAHFLYGLPKIPFLVTETLDSIPSDLEIQRAMFDLGPNKAPGPDGFNAKLFQENWELFGPMIISEVRSFFSTGIMKKGIAKSDRKSTRLNSSHAQ